MFYCTDCQKKEEWPEGIRTSVGPCEVCGETKECYDVPSSQLPKKLPNTYPMSVEVTHDDPMKPRIFLHQEVLSGSFEHKGKIYTFGLDMAIGNSTFAMCVKNEDGQWEQRVIGDLRPMLQEWVQQVWDERIVNNLKS